jgi:hypothetical protein
MSEAGLPVGDFRAPPNGGRGTIKVALLKVTSVKTGLTPEFHKVFAARPLLSLPMASKIAPNSGSACTGLGFLSRILGREKRPSPR